MTSEARTTNARTMAVVVVALLAIVVAIGWVASEVPLKSDDFAYLGWGLENAGDPTAWLRPAWGPHQRVLNDLVWWISAQTGITGLFARVAQIGLWTGTVGALAGVAWTRTREREAAIFAMLALLFDQVFVDLLQWKSWLTTTGTLVGLVVGLAELTRPTPRWSVVLVAGAFALGFKETGVFVLAAAALAAAPRSLWPVSVALAAGAMFCGRAATYKLGVDFVPTNVHEHLRHLALVGWALPALVAPAWPTRAPSWALAGLAACVVLPATLTGLIVLGAAAYAVRDDRRLAVALAVAWGVPLFGSHHAAQYLLEGWLVVVAAVAWRGGVRLHPVVWLAMALAAAPSATDFWRAHWRERPTAAEQAAFIASFHPAPATVLCPPRPGFAYDVDVLAWLQTGARFDYHPCAAGTVPREIGPRSGVWVDPAPAP